jgi:CP family cyanate transporter-like MFS transporter
VTTPPGDGTATHAGSANRTLAPRIGFALVGLLLVGANLRASITAVGPVLSDITSDLGLTAAAAGLLAAVPLLAFAAFSPVAPAVARRLGLERTLWLSLILLAAGIVLRSLPVAGALWVGTALLGAAIAFINVLLPSLVKREFPDRVGPVTGAYSVAQSIVAAVASAIAVPLAGQAQDGWRLAIGIWAGFALVAAGIFLPQLSRRAVAARRRSAEALAASEDRRRTSASEPTTSGRSPWRSAIAWQVTVFMGLQSTLFYVVINWLPSIEHSAGIAPATAGVHLFAFQIMNMTGNIITAGLLHRMKDQRLLALGCSVLGFVGVCGVLLAPQLILLWVAVLGIAAGSSILIALSLFGLRTRHHAQTARLSGMAQSIGYLLAAPGPVVFGLLHQATGGWSVPLAVLAGLIIVQGVFGVLAGRARFLG